MKKGSTWAALVIAGKDLRQRVRDRSAVLIAVVAPLVIAALLSFAFGSVENFHFTLAVADADHGAAASGLVASLRRPALAQWVTVRTVADRAAAAADLSSGEAQAALVVPAGFSAALSGTQPLGLTTLTSASNAIAGQITKAIASSYVAQLNADRLSVATAVAAGAPVSQLAALEADAAGLRIPEQVEERAVGARPLSVASYYSPAMAIFFLLFVVSFTARSFFVERDQGMIERIRAAPVGPLSILAGKALSAFVFGLMSLGLLAVVTSLAFGADWGTPLAAGAVCVAMVVAVVCLTALVMVLARTQRQSDGIASAITFGLAVLGGNFVSLSMAPEIMRRIALFTPNGWALRAFTDLATSGGGLRTVVAPVLGILAFSAAVTVVTAALARRAVSS